MHPSKKKIFWRPDHFIRTYLFEHNIPCLVHLKLKAVKGYVSIKKFSDCRAVVIQENNTLKTWTEVTGTGKTNRELSSMTEVIAEHLICGENPFKTSTRTLGSLSINVNMQIIVSMAPFEVIYWPKGQWYSWRNTSNSNYPEIFSISDTFYTLNHLQLGFTNEKWFNLSGFFQTLATAVDALDAKYETIRLPSKLCAGKGEWNQITDVCTTVTGCWGSDAGRVVC